MPYLLIVHHVGIVPTICLLYSPPFLTFLKTKRHCCVDKQRISLLKVNHIDHYLICSLHPLINIMTNLDTNAVNLVARSHVVKRNVVVDSTSVEMAITASLFCLFLIYNSDRSREQEEELKIVFLALARTTTTPITTTT